MKIHFVHYELQPARSLNRINGGAPRRGALIRVDFVGKGSGYRGYADIHPWPEFGDAPLEDQLRSLITGRLTPLTRQSLHFAEIDARARYSEVSLFEGLEIPPSHALVTDPALLDPNSLGVLAAAGFDRIKLKLGRDLPAEALRLRQLAAKMPAGMKLRLDFNSGASETELDAFLSGLGQQGATGPNLTDFVDFLEDPMPWSAMGWAQVRKKHGVRLALDWEISRAQGLGGGFALRDSVDVLVVKPAVQQIEIASVPRVFTSYLDHPVGQMFAAYEAARAARSRKGSVETCGLLSHLAYSPTSYSERVRSSGPRLLPTEGVGVGFTELLEGEDWKALT